MNELTPDRKEIAKDILARYTIALHNNRRISVTPFELELRQVWNMGYSEIKDVMIDIIKNHSEYTHLSAYYMENSNPVGVVAEFQQPLTELYGLSSWYYDADKESKRNEFWNNAFALISQFDLGSPNDESSIITISSKVKEQLINQFASNPNLMYSMQPRQFEELIAELLSNFGWSVELTKATRDGGCDIIAIGNNTLATSKYLIECKRYSPSNKVGVQPVRSLFGVVQSKRASKGILVTTSSFTKPANIFIQDNQLQLEGRDFTGILEWLKNYQSLRSIQIT